MCLCVTKTVRISCQRNLGLFNLQEAVPATAIDEQVLATFIEDKTSIITGHHR